MFVKANPESSQGDGTMGNPYGSLSQAIQEAGERIVIACADRFDTLEISGWNAGGPLRLFGGFDCSKQSGVWEPSENPTVVSAPSGPALTITDSTNVEIEGFEFRGPTTDQDSRSSIAAVVEGSQEIVFRNVRFVATNGARGADGDDPAMALANAPVGHNALNANPGAAQTACTCSDSKGGRGGETNASSQRHGLPGSPEEWGGGQGGSGDAPCQAGSNCAGAARSPP